MNVREKTTIIQPDYKALRELSKRIDCSVTEADFYTSHPNPLRIPYMISDINRYTRRINGRI